MLFRVMIAEDGDDYVYSSDLSSIEDARMVKEKASIWLKQGAYLYIEMYEKENPSKGLRITI